MNQSPSLWCRPLASISARLTGGVVFTSAPFVRFNIDDLPEAVQHLAASQGGEQMAESEGLAIWWSGENVRPSPPGSLNGPGLTRARTFKNVPAGRDGVVWRMPGADPEACPIRSVDFSGLQFSNRHYPLMLFAPFFRGVTKKRRGMGAFFTLNLSCLQAGCPLGRDARSPVRSCPVHPSVFDAQCRLASGAAGELFCGPKTGCRAQKTCWCKRSRLRFDLDIFQPKQKK